MLFKNSLIAILSTLAALATQHAHAAWVEKGYAVPSRPGIDQPFVLAADKSLTDPKSVKNVVIYLSGGAGWIAPPQDNTAETRTTPTGQKIPSLRGFLAEKLGVTVAIGLPSDMQKSGLGLEWREGPEHVQDVRAVVNILIKQYPEAKFTILGFSNGGRSAANVGAGLAKTDLREKLQGVVLMSSSIDAFNPQWINTLAGKNGERKVPILVVHHKRDSCLFFHDIEDEAKWHAFIAVDDVRLPRVTSTMNNAKRDCGGGSGHQFAGREEWVYQAVVDWIKTGKVTESN